MRKLSFQNILLSCNNNFTNCTKIFKRFANIINGKKDSNDSKKFNKSENSNFNNDLNNSSKIKSGLRIQSKEKLKSEFKKKLENNSENLLNQETISDTSLYKKEKVFCTFRFDDQFNTVENLPKEFIGDADDKSNDDGQASGIDSNNSKKEGNSSPNTNTKSNEPLGKTVISKRKD